MTDFTFDASLALSLYQSDEPFPVDLDDAWQWLGYNNKQFAEEKLRYNFEAGIDFLYKGIKSPAGGRPRKCILLSIDCFKHLAMMAGTQQGKVIRKYFLECERIAKAAMIKSLKAPDLTAQFSKLKESEAIEGELCARRSELQDVMKCQYSIAKKYYDNNSIVVQQTLACQEIIENAKKCNKYPLLC